MKSWLKFTHKIDSAIRHHDKLSILMIILVGLVIAGTQYGTYYYASSYYLIVTDWTIGALGVLTFLAFSIYLTISIQIWHDKQKIGLRQVVDLKHLNKNKK